MRITGYMYNKHVAGFTNTAIGLTRYTIDD